MGITIILVYLLSVILLLPYVLILIIILLQGLYILSIRKPRMLFLGVPYRIIQRITRGGALRYALYKVSSIPSNSFRLLIYKITGASIAKNVIIHYGLEVRAPQFLHIGKGSIIGDNAILDARSGLSLGRNVNLSSNVSIYTLQHNHRSPSFNCVFSDRKLSVSIGDRVWLGCNVVVLPGVSIGEGAVVCAGSIVTKDVSPFTIVAGIPAHKVGERPSNITYEFDGKTCWFL
ncbi:MAG: acyltransferase [Muribaculaceae bacterium]|nr:acyltransferase [Muribaculaceae bacterium]